MRQFLDMNIKTNFVVNILADGQPIESFISTSEFALESKLDLGSPVVYQDDDCYSGIPHYSQNPSTIVPSPFVATYLKEKIA